MTVYGKGRIRPFPVFLSLLVPGTGEMYLGHPGRALILWLVRILVPVFIPVYLYDSRIDPACPFAAGIFVLLFLWMYSIRSAVSLSRVSNEFEESRKCGISIIFFYFIIHFVSFFLSMMFFLSSVHPQIVKKGLFPSIAPGSVVFVSKRSSDIYAPGDLILDKKNSFVRIIAAGESYIEYSDGVFNVDGALFKQTPPESLPVKISAGDEVFVEDSGSFFHLVARRKTAEKRIVSFSLAPKEFLVISDDRRDTVPVVMQENEARGLVAPLSFPMFKGVIR
jgi:TM2 domain-containing membrane protein YozV